jgi:hypothetical protein
MMFSIQSTTEVTVSHLEIAKKEETAMGQVQREGNA